MANIAKMLEQLNKKKGENGPLGYQMEMTECCICYDNPPDTVIMPCGHGGICYECSLSIWEADKGCYLCRKEMVEVL